MEKRDTSKSVFDNFVWRFLERTGAQGVAFVVQILLARLLDPEVYGTIALITVFTSILSVFIDSGLGNALIQKKDADNLDFSVVFFFNITMCGALYLLLFISAPYVAYFYDDIELIPVIRVLGITIVISGIKNVQQAYVSRTMQFKKFFFATLGGTIGAAILGIVLALSGFGVWALVAQHLFNTMVDTVILWITVKWRPQKAFSITRLKILFSYGWKLLVSSLLNTIYTETRQLIIGKKYSSEDLAFYNRGLQLPQYITTNINASIDSVLLPSMSSAQDNRERVRAMTRRSIKTSTYIMAPLLIGLAACGESVVLILLTEKWLPCVPFLSIFCISALFRPIHTANLNAIKAMGRSDMFLKLEIIKTIFGISLLLISMPFGVMVMAYSALLSNVVSQIINSWPNRKLLNYRYLEQLKDIIPGIFLAGVMGVVVYFLGFIPLPTVIILVIQICSGAVMYIGGSAILKLESYLYVKAFLLSYLKKHR